MEFVSTTDTSCREKFDAALCEYKAETSPDSTLELLERELWLDIELLLERLLEAGTSELSRANAGTSELPEPLLMESRTCSKLTMYI